MPVVIQVMTRKTVVRRGVTVSERCERPRCSQTVVIRVANWLRSSPATTARTHVDMQSEGSTPYRPVGRRRFGGGIAPHVTRFLLQNGGTGTLGRTMALPAAVSTRAAILAEAL